MAYVVPIETSSPARIEVNNQDMGEAPLNIKIFGDPDGTFHDFGSYYYVVRALPASTNSNQFAQTMVFRTGHLMTPEDRIPTKIYFDMSRPAPSYPPPPPAGYYGPPPYPYPYYYGAPYYGPGVQFYFGPGPGYYHRHW